MLNHQIIEGSLSLLIMIKIIHNHLSKSPFLDYFLNSIFPFPECETKNRNYDPTVPNASRTLYLDGFVGVFMDSGVCGQTPTN